MIKKKFFKRSFRNNVYISVCGAWKVVRSTTHTKELTYANTQNQWDLYSLFDPDAPDDSAWEFIQTFPNMNEIKSFLNINQEEYV